MRIENKRARLTSMLLAFIMVFSTIASVPARAASLPSLSTKKYIQTYAIKSSGRIYAYTDSSLKNQKGSNWYIDCATDECRIVKVTANAVQVSYPIGNGKWVTQPQWFSRSEFSTANLASPSQYVKLNQRVYTYRRSDARISYGYAAAGDYVYLFDSRGSQGLYSQIIYPLSNGQWKLGWAKTLDINRALMNSTTTTVKQQTNSSTNAVTTQKNSGTNSAVQILTSAEINTAVKKYSLNDSQRKALETINSRYASQLNNDQKKGTLIFMFEGCGSDSNTYKGFNSSIAEGKKRANAMCVVIKANKVVLVDKKSSSLPSTYYKSDNGKKNVPTLVSGIYKFSYAGYGGSLGYYYNLTTLSNSANLSVVRYDRDAKSDDKMFYKSTSSGIKIHEKGYGTGCQLVGYSSYNRFNKADGNNQSFLSAVGKNGSSGLYIVDRSSFGKTYLKNMKYSENAIKLIG